MTLPIGFPEQLRREVAPLQAAPEQKLPIDFAPHKVQQPTSSGVLDEQGRIAGSAFADHLASFVSGVVKTQQLAEHVSEEFAVGHHNDIHGTMIAEEQADISLRLLANVRNRAVDLYREVMRMGS